MRTDYFEKLHYYEETDSTNDRLYEFAVNGAPEGTVVIAGAQTNGHGRSGRTFYSPAGGNLYMSVLLRPNNTEVIGLITPAAAVAVARAIKEVCGIDARIKWVNDLFANGRKICGILAMGYDFGGKSPYVILGIGVNIYESSNVPEDIRDKYGAIIKSDDLTDDCNLSEKLGEEIYRQFASIYNALPGRDFMAEYRERSNVIGKEVSYLSGDKVQRVEVIDIDDDGGLTVRENDGNVRTYRDGEIRICL